MKYPISFHIFHNPFIFKLFKLVCSLIFHQIFPLSMHCIKHCCELSVTFSIISCCRHQSLILIFNQIVCAVVVITVLLAVALHMASFSSASGSSGGNHTQEKLGSWGCTGFLTEAQKADLQQ